MPVPTAQTQTVKVAYEQAFERGLKLASLHLADELGMDPDILHREMQEKAANFFSSAAKGLWDVGKNTANLAWQGGKAYAKNNKHLQQAAGSKGFQALMGSAPVRGLRSGANSLANAGRRGWNAMQNTRGVMGDVYSNLRAGGQGALRSAMSAGRAGLRNANQTWSTTGKVLGGVGTAGALGGAGYLGYRGMQGAMSGNPQARRGMPAGMFGAGLASFR